MFEKLFLAKLLHAAKRVFENSEPAFPRLSKTELDPEAGIESDISKEQNSNKYDFLQEIVFGQRSEAEAEARNSARRQAIPRPFASKPSSRR